MSRWKSLIHVSRSSAPLTLFLKELSYRSPNLHHCEHLVAVYDSILKPCLTTKSHCARDIGTGNLCTVQLPFHECPGLSIADYFSALGYLLTHIYNQLTFVELIQLLGQYAEWCRVSASVLSVNPPTVVQVLFDSRLDWPRDFETLGASKIARFSLASSVSAGKGDGREDIRDQRTKAVQAFWSHPLIQPTPVQRAHVMAGIGFSNRALEPSAELFGTPWGHCGESVSFPSLYKSMHTGRPLGTLALSVKAMTTAIPGTSTIPVYAMQSLTHFSDIIELLRVSGSMRTMCLNCLYLRDGAGAKVEDYAARFSSSNSEIWTPS
ncbi:hypothetical protein K435DRAFT_749058 [Dendrothele bispora CBS 962.96]|uniref:Uncharacterized protein n=1 Tax=Dendrothele bispora (strain CBS 962.96) TaxID=1314807 RepID=A0A4S8MJE8_DENBC|nr:hypothetical protein K435DRAFT_749058 [Dendrothele bispora CBS 962.96]